MPNTFSKKQQSKYNVQFFAMVRGRENSLLRLRNQSTKKSFVLRQRFSSLIKSLCCSANEFCTMKTHKRICLSHMQKQCAHHISGKSVVFRVLEASDTQFLQSTIALFFYLSVVVSKKKLISSFRKTHSKQIFVFGSSFFTSQNFFNC